MIVGLILAVAVSFSSFGSAVSVCEVLVVVVELVLFVLEVVETACCTVVNSVSGSFGSWAGGAVPGEKRSSSWCDKETRHQTHTFRTLF